MEEEEICRVCRSEASEEEPLYHPCKCTGSIRFIHQDCLMDWLSHSNKKYCELCNYYYKFTPVYQKDMPPIIPKRLFLQHAIKMVYTATQWILRACLASFIWLGMVPYITVWIWRLHFWCIATISHLHATHTSDTATRKKEGVLNTILYDCFQGWLLDIGIIVILIVGFLLREWVLQNVPTEFHDLEDLQDEPVQAVVDHPVAQQQQRIEQEPIIEHRHGEEDSMPRDRMNHARRPPLLQEPSNYENLEAMWLMNERQASPPRRNLEYQLDDSESEDEQTSPERIQEMLDSIREEHRLAQEAQQFDHLAIQPGINNDGPINDRPLEEANINEGIEHMDDILEVVGLRGSIRMLLQNSGLMILLYTLCLSVGAWLPYVLGVFFIKSQPWNGVVLIFKAMQYLSDPLIDCISDCWFHFYSHSRSISYYLSEWTPTLIQSIILAATDVEQSLISFFSTNGTIDSTVLSSNTVKDTVSLQLHSLLLWQDLLLGYVAPKSQHFLQTYTQMPHGTSIMDRAGCITTGYLVLAIIGSLYLSRTHDIYAWFSRATGFIIHELGVFLKVGFFVILEINIFPLGCGLLLDAVSLPLFYKIGGTADYLLALLERMTFLKQNLLTSTFLHWVVGTGFMFLFTAMVSFCRKIVRPGVIWFIRDPNDPQFHPMKELAERSVWTQLQKIGASAVIYGLIIEFGVGGLVAAIAALFDGILPLKWSYTQPLSIVPIDLLFVMIAIPTLIHYFDPKQLLENFIVQWAGWLCHQLRLSSFLLDKRPMNEEGHYKTWKAWIQRPELNGDADGGTFVKSGQLVRAPKHDSVKYVPGRRMLVPVDPVTFEPIEKLERELGHPAGEDTTIIYLPPHFKLRMALFMAIMWAFWCILICCLFVCPIVLGRWVLVYLDIQIQDVYAYLLGGIILIFIGVLIKLASVNSFQLSWIFNLCVLLVSFGFIIPVLFGSIFYLYVILPFQNWGTQAPVIDALSIWANGLVCLTLFQGILSVLPANKLHDCFERIQGNGILHFSAKREIKEFIGPIVFVGLAAIVLPYLLVIVQIQWLEPAKQVSVLQTTYPAMFIGLVLYYFNCAFTKFGKRWSQSVRENHYLIGRVLHNIEEI